MWGPKVRYRYVDGEYEAIIYNKNENGWSWVLYYKTKPIAAGTEELNYRAKYEAEKFLNYFKKGDH